MAGPYSITLSAGMISTTEQVTTLDSDNVYEGNELFSLIINETLLPTRVEARSGCSLQITIVDVDSKLLDFSIIHNFLGLVSYNYNPIVHLAVNP